MVKIIFGIWGEDKTAKTTLALTFPKPLVHMEFDVGGFERAKYRFKKDIASGDITTKIYAIPFQYGNFDPNKLTIRPSNKIVGMKELFYKWLADYMSHLQNDKVSTIVIDTATLLWEIVCTGYLQEKQELRSPTDKPRVSLLPIEYREPNIRMRGIVYQAKAHGKHLVLTHHSRDQYGVMPVRGEMVEQKTGKRERSGWTPLGDGADIIVHTYTKKDTKGILPYCTVELAEVLSLVGMEFKEPSYDKIAKTIAMMRGEV